MANAAAISSNKTATAKSNSDFPVQYKRVKSKFVEAIMIPAINKAFKAPALIANTPPNRVKQIVVIQPIPFE